MKELYVIADQALVWIPWALSPTAKKTSSAIYTHAYDACEHAVEPIDK